MSRRRSGTTRCGRTSTACCGTSSSSGRRSSSVRLTRRQMLAGAAASALAAGGIYELVDQLGGDTPARAVPLDRPGEQHLLDGVAEVVDNNVEVIVPPRHHQLVTANIRAGDVRGARADLVGMLEELDRRKDARPPAPGATP